MAKIRAILPLMAALLSVSCVTETSGGFGVDASREQALDDYIRLAAGYYEADDLVRAKRHVDNALEIDRRSSQAHNIRALIHQREGEIELARQTFERAISLDRNNSRARNNYAAFLFAHGEYEEAYQQLEQVATDTEYDSRPMAFQNLGLAALRTDRTERAREAFERALMLDRNLFRSSLELAQIHYDRGEFAEAMQHYQQFLTTSSFRGVRQTARSLLLGVRLEQRFDNQDAARAYAEQLRERFRDSPEYRAYQNINDGENRAAEHGRL